MAETILAGYPEFFEDLKRRIRASQSAAVRAVNCELILLYWDIGQGILSRQRDLGWGESVVATLAKDLQAAFPGTSGFSPRNLWDMRRFVEAFSEPEILRHAVAELGRTGLRKGERPDPSSVLKILRQRVAEIPWGSLLVILNKTSDARERLYYVAATGRLGWTRHVLLNQIKAQAYQRARAEKKTHNFSLAR